MAEKAMVWRIYGVAREPGPEYILTAEVSVTNGEGAGHILMTVEAIAPNWTPLVPTWRVRLIDAVIAKALDEQGLTVDNDVKFPSDFAV